MDGEVGAAEEGAAEAAVGDEIEVLLEGDFVASGEDTEFGEGFGRNVGAEGGAEEAFGEVLEAMAGGEGDEVGDVEAVVGAAEFVVEGDGVGSGIEAFDFGIEGGLPEGVGDEAADGGEEVFAVGDARGFGAGGLGMHDLAGGFAGVGLGVGVVAREDDAVGREMGLADGEEFFEDEGGDPGAEAVGDDVVEGAEGRGEFEDVESEEFDVREAQGLDDGLADLDGAGGEVEADEVGEGVDEGHGDEVAGIAAADFEDAAGAGGGREAVKRGDGGEVVGVGFGESEAGVENLVVGGWHIAFVIVIVDQNRGQSLLPGDAVDPHDFVGTGGALCVDEVLRALALGFEGVGADGAGGDLLAGGLIDVEMAGAGGGVEVGGQG